MNVVSLVQPLDFGFGFVCCMWTFHIYFPNCSRSTLTPEFRFILIQQKHTPSTCFKFTFSFEKQFAL